jgi:mono/diheme cytochrome c family protein
MPDAKGAVGAGAYPALANNPNLASPVYPAVVIVNGQKAMPAFGGYFSDDQIAAVINYVRSNFGNHYADKITPDQVKSVRPVKAQSAEMF